jgi:hypothetical protein
LSSWPLTKKGETIKVFEAIAPPIIIIVSIKTKADAVLASREEDKEWKGDRIVKP